MARFTDQTVIVTGGNSGIGRAAALRFAAEGARVALIARNADTGDAVAAEIAQAGGEAFFVAADVSEPEQVRHAFEAILARFGSFGIAFNCAGDPGPAQPFHALEDAQFDAIVRTNLYGAYYCMKHEIAHFRNVGGGVIVNCASTAGLVGFPSLAPYNASKHGLLGLTKSVALDYAQHGIRVNAVCPGGVLTNHLESYFEDHPEAKAQVFASHPIGRMARPDEISGLVLWLSSNEASNVTGQCYAIDGGYTVR